MCNGIRIYVYMAMVKTCNVLSLQHGNPFSEQLMIFDKFNNEEYRLLLL